MGNLDTFAAFILGSGVKKWYHFCVWSFSDALEEERLHQRINGSIAFVRQHNGLSEAAVYSSILSELLN
jgi:hypothetical protein